jgi:hypothetical protein
VLLSPVDTLVDLVGVTELVAGGIPRLVQSGVDLVVVLVGELPSIPSDAGPPQSGMPTAASGRVADGPPDRCGHRRA